MNDNNLISSLERINVFLTEVFQNRQLCLYELIPEEVYLLQRANFARHIFWTESEIFTETWFKRFRD